MQNQQVLLTGGTGGLGRGVIPLVLAQGAKVTVPYLSEASLEKLQDELPQADFERIAFVKVNLQQEEMVKELIQKLGRVDVLIHLVGGFSMGSVEEYSFTDWKQDFDLNLHSTFLVCKYCLKKMRQWNYGRIITVGSRGAIQPAAQLGAYCASKAGVVALTQVIAQETQNSNITANCVLPSVIDTPGNREAMGSDNAEAWVSPQSLGEVICFLASEAAKDIRGAAIPVYGNA